jgi:hypothetical protein
MVLPSLKIAGITGAVALVCAYRLSLVAYETGNWRGMWFSLAHVLVVTVGVALSLREVR